MRPEYARERAKGHVLPVGTLARFASGMPWREILALDSTRGAAWWRCAVADAEDRGLLEWDRGAAWWRLSEEGRAAVVGVS